MVEVHHCSAKHQQGSFHESESRQTVFDHAVADFADKLLFVSLQQNKPMFSNTIYQGWPTPRSPSTGQSQSLSWSIALN